MKTFKILSQIALAGLITAAVVVSSQGDGTTAGSIAPCGNLNDTFSTGTDNWTNRYSTFHPLGFAPAQESDASGDYLLIQSRIPSAQQGTLVTTFQNIVTPYTPKLGVFNSEQWKCNASQVSAVQVDVQNPTNMPLNLTFILQNGFTQGPRPDLTSGFFNSSSPLRLNISQYGAKPQVVQPGTGNPVTLTFSLDPSNMVQIDGAPMSYPQVRNNVSKVFIRQTNSSTLEPSSLNASLKIYGVRTQ
ncbi:MAG: hypothetical protein AAF481_12145 [Acidobacteriota bacterium]